MNSQDFMSVFHVRGNLTIIARLGINDIYKWSVTILFVGICFMLGEYLGWGGSGPLQNEILVIFWTCLGEYIYISEIWTSCLTYKSMWSVSYDERNVSEITMNQREK